MKLECLMTVWPSIKRSIELAFASGMNSGVDPRGGECREKIITDLKAELFGHAEEAPAPLATKTEETRVLSETDKQKAKIMLLHGTPEQQWDALTSTGVIPPTTPKTKENLDMAVGMVRDFKMIYHCLGG
jgi:hypothetical protein